MSDTFFYGFEITDVQVTNPVAGSAAEVTATIQNNLESSSTQTIGFDAQGLGSEAQSLSLTPGSSEDVTVSFATDSDDAESAFDVTVTTDNDEDDTQTINVQDSGANYAVDITQDTYTIADGVDEELTVDIDVTNDGNEDGSAQTLTVGGTSNDDVPDVTVDVPAIDAGNTETVSATLDVSSLETTDSLYEITAANGEVDSVGSDTADIDITEPDDSDLYDFDRNEGTNSGATLYQGQEVLYDVTDIPGSTTDDLRLYRLDTSGDTNELGTSVAALDGDDGRVVIDTENRDEGQYVISTQSTGDAVDTEDPNYDIRLSVIPQDLDAEFDGDTVGDQGDDALVDYEIDSTARNNYNVNIDVDGLDEEDLEQIFDDAFTGDEVLEDTDDYDRYDVASAGASSGDYALHVEDGYITLFGAEGDHELNFTDIDADDYDFNASVVDSTAEDEDSITVEESGDGEVNIEEGSLTQEQGDVIEFNVTADGTASSGTVVVGDEDDFGYQSNVTINDFGDDDQVTLEFNTYTAGLEDETAVSLVDTDDDDDEIDVEYETELNNILSSGDYDISSSASSDFDETLDNSDDVATLFIEERTTENLQLWTASDDTASDVTDADDDEQLGEITSAVEDDLITQTETVAYDDVSVHQLSASGLEGALDYAANAGGYDDDDVAGQLAYLATNNVNNDLNDDTAVQLRIRETRDSAGPNANRRTVDLTATDFDVVEDEANDDYYILLDTSDVTFTDDDGSLDNDEDVDFTVEFTVQDQRLLDPEDD
ncbi:hypothetical protein C472_09141, partial [Halorubrum tebenquichense DSM 14210]